MFHKLCGAVVFVLASGTALAAGVHTDAVDELTSGAGVVVDGVTIKDGKASGAATADGDAATTLATKGYVDGRGVDWIVATDPVVQMEAQHGYIADSASEIVFTLPASPAVGDVVRVCGAGAGGWRIGQNAGQQVETGALQDAAARWVARTHFDAWAGVASSADGSKLAACCYGGRMYTSGDYGVTWTARDSDRDWLDVAASSDGGKLVACVELGQLFTSDDSGATWTARDSDRDWTAVASSSDGSTLAACVYGGAIYRSGDSGATWAPLAAAGTHDWLDIASSADGARLLAMDEAGAVYTSSDSGASWTTHALGVASLWMSVTSSADGAVLAVCGSEDRIYVSTDSGANWNPRGEMSPFWSCITCSADGATLIAGQDTCDFMFWGMSGVQRSKDTGATWQDIGGDDLWWSLACSADGQRLVGAQTFGRVYTYDGRDQTTPGVSGAISGVSDGAVELLYVGGGTWRPLSHEGAINPE